MTTSALAPLEDALVLSTAELSALALALGQGVPVPVRQTAWAEQPSAVRLAALQTAARDLAARGLVALADETVQLSRDLAELVTLTAAPALVVSVVVEDPDGTQHLRELLADPQSCVEHVLRADGCHQLRPMATADLLAHLVELSGLSRAGDGASGEASTIALRDFAALLDAPDPTPGLASAVRARVRAVSLASAYRPDPDTVSGGQLSWLDAGEAGVWEIEVSDEAVTGSPTTPARLVDQLLALLPS